MPQIIPFCQVKFKVFATFCRNHSSTFGSKGGAKLPAKILQLPRKIHSLKFQTRPDQIGAANVKFFPLGRFLISRGLTLTNLRPDKINR
ncbi:MAG: hypothetical protein A2126_01655 [Candidatus Woykebacteria bacterium GWB1_45_5]|uniref:Uncharacterized protein n=1 Tax=Candidatus Woykebacteria bacterium GWB1_45_5 TaxID=1802592 RepID=A0A1G1W8P3_9BACT|nr:MAG: hypothetical protein A2126_01655 [Candidatus Woykebacteria bacterium GWB1_45_5]